MNLLEEINKRIPDNLKTEIKELVAKFNATPAAITQPAPAVAAPVAPAALAAIETKLKDGSILTSDKMEVGGTAELTLADGTKQPANGEYTAEDGTVIVCVAGVISEIKPAENADPTESTPADQMPEMMKALENRLAAVEAKFAEKLKENETLKTELSEVSKSTNVALTAINSILGTSAGEPIEKKSASVKKGDVLTALGDKLNNKQ